MCLEEQDHLQNSVGSICFADVGEAAEQKLDNNTLRSVRSVLNYSQKKTVETAIDKKSRLFRVPGD